MADPAEEWVTIAEASRRLGVAPRQARRYAARLRPEDRCEDTVPLRVLFSSLERLRSDGEEQGQARDAPRDSVPPGVPPPTPDGDPPAAADAALSLAFETALQAKERVISELEARVADLHAALDHERETSRRLSDALTREQTLRALPPPQAQTSDAPAAAADHSANSAPETENAGGVASDAPKTPDPPQSRAEGRIRAFWQRLWGRPSS